jgi:predicted DNA-binding WGR domain protein
MAFLTHHDPPKNEHRFYVVTVVPELFGGWSVVREWGRIGSPGTLRSVSFMQEQEARTAEQRSIRERLRHGYTMRA